MKTYQDFFTPLADYYQLPRPCSWEKIFRNKAPLELEIGFGHGEVLIQKAQSHPERNYIGIEQQWQRLFRALKTIDRIQRTRNDPAVLKNICLFNSDARDMLARSFAPKNIDHVYSLFPCPWPKAKHEKHRLFSRNFLQLLNNRLKEKGILTIVTDARCFAQWIEEQIPQTGFSCRVRTIHPEFNTKFERKWKREGIRDYFELELRKIKHLRAPALKDTAMKSYKLKDFSPEKFHFESIKGNPAVIFKDYVYDPSRKKAMVQVLVVEDHLNQYLSITIVHLGAFWRVFKTDGQQFLPTPAVAMAIEAVYKAAAKATE